MGDTPWSGDACSLVDEFRARRRSPAEELRATLDAISASSLNAFCHLDTEAALDAAARADVGAPFGGVPIGVKELDQVAGWPDTHASMPLRHQVADRTSIMVQRVRDLGGAVLVGQTTASEFGGVNLTRTVLHGATHNPWQAGRTPGGSSGGSAAAVAGGLCTLATAGDGGGSIRIPAGFTGLVGLKSTYGRIPRGPHAQYGNLTVTVGASRGRSATPPAGSTSATASIREIRSACPVSMAGTQGLATTARHCVRPALRSPPRGAMPSSRRRCGTCSRSSACGSSASTACDGSTTSMSRCRAWGPHGR